MGGLFVYFIFGLWGKKGVTGFERGQSGGGSRDWIGLCLLFWAFRPVWYLTFTRTNFVIMGKFEV